MFDLGKKSGSDKVQDDSTRQQDRPEIRNEAAPTPRRPAGAREAAVIGPSIHIDGDLRGEEDLLIEGEVNGTVELKHNILTIGPQGKVRADVYARAVYVEGYVEGDLYGAERVGIRKSAQVRGNITSPSVSLEDGAKFKGSIEMDPKAVESALGSGRGGLESQKSAQPQQAAAKPATNVSPKPVEPAAKSGAAS
ncbi:MAG TPA: polymer-forming cytoskeletal protein [Gammaproteobacteria bacterium]